MSELKTTVDGNALDVLNHFKDDPEWQFAPPPYYLQEFRWDTQAKVCKCESKTFWAFLVNTRTLDEVLVLCCQKCLAVEEHWTIDPGAGGE